MALELRQCSRIRYARILKTVMLRNPTTVLNSKVRLGQRCRTIRIHEVTKPQPITVAPAPIAASKSKSRASLVKIPSGNRRNP